MAKTEGALGFEVCGDQVRVVFLETTDGEPIVRLARSVRPGDELARLVRSLKPRPSMCVGAIPMQHGAVRVLSLPPTTEENLARVVALEAESAVPLPADQIALAHHSLGLTEQSRMEVMVAAGMTSEVQQTLEHANAGSWMTAHVTLSSAALLNAVRRLEPSSGPLAILVVEADHSEICVVEKDRLHTARYVSTGCGQGGDLQWVEAVAQQVQYTLQSVSFEKGLQIERVHVCGRGAELAGSSEALSAALGIAAPPLVIPGGSEPALYPVAFGCALQAAGLAGLALNLVPTVVTVQREREQRRQHRFSSVALIAAAVLALSIVLYALAEKREDEAEMMAERVKEIGLPPRGKIPSPSLLDKAGKSLDNLQKVRVSAAAALTGLNQELPQGAWLTEWSYSAQSGSVVRGYSLDPIAPQQAQISLLRQRKFDEVTLDFLQQEKLDQTDAWGFQLSCKLRAPARNARQTRTAKR